jgi:DNA-binding response OmpR family regulator
MASILIAESSSELAELLKRFVEHLGHEGFVYTTGAEHRAFNVLLLEPASTRALGIALAARKVDPALPIVCVTRGPLPAQVRLLAPIAWVSKPFTIADLEGAIDCALEAERPYGIHTSGRPNSIPAHRCSECQSTDPSDKGNAE